VSFQFPAPSFQLEETKERIDLREARREAALNWLAAASW